MIKIIKRAMISNSQYHLRTHFCAHVETTSQEYSTTITFRAILSYTFIYVGVIIILYSVVVYRYL